jgi:hypothetical protein
MSAKIIEKPKRSIELTKEQIKWLSSQIKKHESITAAGISLGISKDVLSRTMAFGSCSEKTYKTLFSDSSIRISNNAA